MPHNLHESSHIHFSLRVQGVQILMSTVTSAISEVAEIFDGRGAFIYGKPSTKHGNR